jgi:hypothetical protein
MCVVHPTTKSIVSSARRKKYIGILMIDADADADALMGVGVLVIAQKKSKETPRRQGAN